jgi:hypothetical protein
MKKLIQLIVLLSSLALLASLTSCSSGGGSYRSGVSYGAGYRGYQGARPWGYYPGYGGGYPVDPDWGVDGGGPVAVPMPEMGRPDFGGMGGMDSMDMGMGMDMGGFDF